MRSRTLHFRYFSFWIIDFCFFPFPLLLFGISSVGLSILVFPFPLLLVHCLFLSFAYFPFPFPAQIRGFPLSPALLASSSSREKMPLEKARNLCRKRKKRCLKNRN